MSELDEILYEYDPDGKGQKTELIDGDIFRRWMASDDLEVLGVVYSIILDKRRILRVLPPISLTEANEFVLRYYERCFQDDPHGVWSDTRYSAGRDLVSWFVSHWDDKDVPRSVLAALKKWMAEMYKSSSGDIRLCLETATLEHLFERKDIAKYFSEWKEDSVLCRGYDAAISWARAHR